MDLQLTDKSALVTGSTKGIGYAIARTLAAEGASVILNGRSQGGVDEAVARLRADLPEAKVRGVAADLSTSDGAKSLFAALPTVDILVNNVGIFEPKPFAEIPDEDWTHTFDVNVMSGVRASRQYLPGMLKKNWGRIVFISSESGVQIPAEMVHYGMTKAAQIAVARGIAESTAGTGVTTNSVLPGPTSSEGVEEFVKQLNDGKSLAEVEKTFFEEARPTSLIKRFATPEEVASLVAYVCSPLSAATNGASLRVDGGVVKSAF